MRGGGRDGGKVQRADGSHVFEGTRCICQKESSEKQQQQGNVDFN